MTSRLGGGELSARSWHVGLVSPKKRYPHFQCFPVICVDCWHDYFFFPASFVSQAFFPKFLTSVPDTSLFSGSGALGGVLGGRQAEQFVRQFVPQFVVLLRNE